MNWNQIETRPGATLTFRSGTHTVDCRVSQSSGLYFFNWDIFRDRESGSTEVLGSWVQMRSADGIGHDEIQSALGQADRIISEKSK